MRAIGLDIGDKTIGVAISDELGLCAHPVETIARRGFRADASATATVISKLGATVVVVGLPLTMDGRLGIRARGVLGFIRVLKEYLRAERERAKEHFVEARRVGDGGEDSKGGEGGGVDVEVQIETWDERFSTVGAERPLLEADLGHGERKKIIDQQAAVFILQGWLDAKRSPE
ncbi:MAG: Holliday junction resolvase RuvX [Pseudomonadota bacterium]